MYDYVMEASLIIFLIIIFYLVYRFNKWIRAKSEAQEEKTRRLKIILLLFSGWMIISGASFLVANRFSLSSVTWRYYLKIFIGISILWSLRRKEPPILEGFTDEEKERLKDDMNIFPLKIAFFVSMLVGSCSIYLIFKYNSPWGILILVASNVPIFVFSKIRRNKINELRIKKGLNKV